MSVFLNSGLFTCVKKTCLGIIRQEYGDIRNFRCIASFSRIAMYEVLAKSKHAVISMLFL